uniref:Mitochondrial import inner membrane translocase subunit TIM17 n=1 Tax=Chromera velia CCMP2878 TaxID=1169474 RepID=A0A0G4GAT0_9ALVE|eukprot:Cvel_21042.t1-p1 / transcript=Cvel_21042.t1 / gene=Cvel_21042 / organism=Chromera_velia_CCMP2878 / gene_product=Mitochondrial import inner membrane translocase, putative / transcript_product=Mitochondrial import inner membrane translocase, putative / location=Cvel_scaffold1942:14848-18752(+) / protein_length=232 / sequence_SO=supercontig / SO=protein_coding / is_pseudo=false
MGERDLGREPCPDRIVEDLGGAFGMGCVGGFIWHFVKGARNSTRGEVLSTALFSAKSRAPVLGGNFAVWGGTFSSFDCTLQYLRQKEDHWNAIASGALTGGVLALRGGWRVASRNAVVGGVLLAIIEGVSAIILRKAANSPRDQMLQQLKMEQEMKEREQRRKETTDAASAGGSGGAGGSGSSLFGGFMQGPAVFSPPSSSSSSSSGGSGAADGSGGGGGESAMSGEILSDR